MFSSLHYLTLPLIACLAVTLDCLIGEPKRYHPLVGFGLVANLIESKLNPKNRHTLSRQKLLGSFGLFLIITPLLFFAFKLSQIPIIGLVTDSFLLYFALGHKSLHEHARAVSNALFNQDIARAKTAASYMVSRDSANVEPIPATIESVLENGNDGVFGALFWFFVAGGTGALAFRLMNTLDAMWGYKTSRYYYFGRAAARLDDLICYVPARLTAMTYALLGHTKTAIRCWRQQAPLWDSPNAGPVMASGAGAMQVKLGGAACYQGEWHQRPILGEGRPPLASDISQALKLVRHGVYSWLIIALLSSTIMGYCYA